MTDTETGAWEATSTLSTFTSSTLPSRLRLCMSSGFSSMSVAASGSSSMFTSTSTPPVHFMATQSTSTLRNSFFREHCFCSTSCQKPLKSSKCSQQSVHTLVEMLSSGRIWARQIGGKGLVG